jgi:hypothetical protein
MFPLHYKYLCGLVILQEDAIGTELGDCTKSDLGHFLGHGPCMAEVYVG